MGGVPEFDFTTWQRSQHLILDDLDYALKQGDLHHWVKSNGLDVDQIQARTTALIGEVALNPEKYQSIWWSDSGVIQGMAVCDVAMAGLALERATAQTWAELSTSIPAKLQMFSAVCDALYVECFHRTRLSCASQDGFAT